MKKIYSLLLIFGLGSISASAQSVLTIAATTTDISSSNGIAFDRIEMTRNVPDDSYTAIAVPATVDGYFFGADAKRFVVSAMTQTADGTYDLKILPMPDADDFQPGTLYLVKPEEGLGATTVYSYTAGIQTAAVATSQPLTAVNSVKAHIAIGSIARTAAQAATTDSAIDAKVALGDIDEIQTLLMVKP